MHSTRPLTANNRNANAQDAHLHEPKHLSKRTLNTEPYAQHRTEKIGKPFYTHLIEPSRPAEQLRSSASQRHHPTRTYTMHIFFAHARVNEYDIYSIVC